MRSSGRRLAAIILGAALGLLGLGLAPASASVSAHNPVGHLDAARLSAVGTNHYATVSGWAFDPDARSSPIFISIRDNGVQKWSGRTGAYRPDVNRMYHLSGDHGYTGVRIHLFAGDHTICVRQINVGAGAPDTSNCIKVRIAPPPPPPAPWTCGAPANPYGYNFCSGPLIYSPPGDICSYFSCIGNFWNGSGYMTECSDGMYSMSGGRSGACSYHGGEWRPVYA